MGIPSTNAYNGSTWCRGPGCDTVGFREEFIEKRYCCHECRYRHEGRNTLRTLVKEHTYCSTCFTRLKTVYRPTEKGRGIQRRGKGINKDGIDFSEYVGHYPPDDPPFQGWQRRTKDADVGEKLYLKSIELYGTGTVCGTCGTTATNAWPTAEELVDPEEAAERFVTAYRYETGEAIDGETVVRVAGETGDLEYAVGRGVE